MANEVSQRLVDSTDGFVSYTQHVKPYHTKILEVSIDYVYSENVEVTITDKWQSTFQFSRPDTDVIRLCGYGIQWDAQRTALDYPTTRIVQSVGDTSVEVIVRRLAPLDLDEVYISYNNNQYTFSVGDAITFSTTASMPQSNEGLVAPGIIYYIVDVNGQSLKVSSTIAGLPLSFLTTGTGTLRIHKHTDDRNSFLIEKEPSPDFTCVVSNTRSNQIAFVSSYNIIGVNVATNTWEVSGDLITSSLVEINDPMFIHNNTGVGVDGRYTVDSVTLNAGNTLITTVEQIPVSAIADGSLNIQNSNTPVPNWPIGTKVSLTTLGSFPIPFDSVTEYHFVPTNTYGVFNLSQKRYPLQYEDIIDIQNTGVGIMTVTRIESFFVGAPVRVSSSYLSRNNGMYFIDSIESEGLFDRIRVRQSITKTTPPFVQYDGVMAIISDGYDFPSYCPPIQAPDLYTEAYIHEYLSFEFSMTLQDMIGPVISEDNGGTYGIIATITNTSPVQAHTLLPTGYDTQFYDVGGIDETLPL